MIIFATMMVEKKNKPHACTSVAKGAFYWEKIANMLRTNWCMWPN
jgi:hypothetical protein